MQKTNQLIATLTDQLTKAPSTPYSTGLRPEPSTQPTPNGSLPLTVTFSDRCPTCGFAPGEPGYIRYDVPVGHPHFGQTEPCPTCHAKTMAARKRFMGPLEGHLSQCRFDNFYDQYNKVALDHARAFAGEPVGVLVLWGGNGRGKTHLLAAIYNQLQTYGVPAKYLSLPDLTSGLRSLISDETHGSPETLYQYISGFPIVLIDDIDYADMRRWTREQMFRLFNRRYVNHQQVGTVLAMEFDPAGDGDMRWLFSRINDERMKVIQMQGPDNRKQLNLIRRLLRVKQAVMGE